MGPFRPCAASMCAVAAFLLSGPGQAQTARSGGGASAQLMQQMQQLAAERTSLQAENDTLKKDLESMRKERDALKKGQQALDQRVRVTESSLKESTVQREATAQELAQLKEKMQQLIAKFRETVQSLREVETQSTAAKQTLAIRDRDLKTCIDRNLALYKLNDEVLTRLEHQTVWGRMARAEPFTRIKRIELENLVDEYKSRADDHRISAGSAQPAAETPAVPAPASPTPASPPK